MENKTWENQNYNQLKARLWSKVQVSLLEKTVIALLDGCERSFQ